MLVWSMRCGSVLLLGLIGIEGTRVFRKNCSVATIRFAKKLQFWAYFCFFGHPDRPHAGAMGGVAWARRLCLMTLGSVVGGAGSAARCGDASGGATWAAGCLGQRDAVNGVGLA